MGYQNQSLASYDITILPDVVGAAGVRAGCGVHAHDSPRGILIEMCQSAQQPRRTRAADNHFKRADILT